MSLDLEEQYDKIYRYCYFRLHQRETAEDITQETFLRFFESRGYVNKGKSLQYLYTIAHNLCVNEYRKPKTEPLDEDMPDGFQEEDLITQISIRTALSELDEADKELLLLRYANDVPVAVIGKLYGISRFAVYRKILRAAKILKKKLGREDEL